MPLRVYTPPPQDRVSGALLGFAITCLAVPAAYATAGYLLAGRGRVFWPPDRALEFAILCGSPLFLGGLAQWWDVWVRPAPKIGANWSRESPRHFVGGLFVYHAIAMAVAAFLLSGERPKEARESLSEAFRVNRVVQAAVVTPGGMPLENGDLASLQSRRDGLYWTAVTSAGTAPNDNKRGEFGPGLLDLLMGVVIVIPSLAVPGRAGFSSGQSIQHS